MSEMLYLQTERNIKITSPVVTLGDVAQLSCSDGAVLARNQTQGQQRRADGKTNVGWIAFLVIAYLLSISYLAFFILLLVSTFTGESVTVG